MRSLAVLLLLVSTAHAAPPEGAWLDGLTARITADLAAGKPLVVEVHVPLCDNTIIACGNPKLGDGDNPDTNLYWSTTPGFGEWFVRRHGGWKRIAKLAGADTGDRDVLAVHAFRRTVAAPAAWQQAGAPKTFELDIVVHGWRGSAIDRALAAYAADTAGPTARTITLADGTHLAAGGAAQIVAWVGHNRLMDLDHFDWPAPPSITKGTIAIACDTADYMERDIPAATRVPLLMTRDLLFANAAPLEAAILAYTSGGGYAEIRRAATAAYAGVQNETVKHVSGVFTNPADKRWHATTR